MLVFYAVCAGIGAGLTILLLLAEAREEGGDPAPNPNPEEGGEGRDASPLDDGAFQVLAVCLAFFGLTGLVLDILDRSFATTLVTAVVLGAPAGLVAGWVLRRLVLSTPTDQPDG